MKATSRLSKVFGLCLISYIGCNVQISQPHAIDLSTAAAADAQPANQACKELSGVWRTYEIPSEKTARMCGDEPCWRVDYAGPIRFNCVEDKLQGVKVLMFASYPPPGREHSTPLEATWRAEELTLRYTDSVKCLTTYVVKLKDGKLTGEYRVEDCAGPNWRGDRGNFLAVKFPAGDAPDAKAGAPPDADSPDR